MRDFLISSAILLLGVLSLGFSFFYEDIPNVTIRTTNGFRRADDNIFFLLRYAVWYAPKGLATFPDGGVSKDALEKIYLFRYNEKEKKLANLGELKLDPRWEFPDFHLTLLAASKNKVFIALTYYVRNAPGLIYYDNIFVFDLDDKTFQLLVPNADIPILSADGKYLAYLGIIDGIRGLCLYDFESGKSSLLHKDASHYEWHDNEHIFLKDYSSPNMLNLNIKDKSIISTDIPHKEYHFSLKDRVVQDKTESFVSNLVFYEEAGLPDPIPYIKGSQSDKALRRIILERKGNHLFRLAIIGRLIKTQKFKTLKEILEHSPSLDTIKEPLERKEWAEEIEVMKKALEEVVHGKI